MPRARQLTTASSNVLLCTMLPSSMAALAKTASSTDPHPAAVRARVLVIDDQPLLVRLLLRWLSDHDVTGETSARAALDRIETGERYDAIVCDVCMPEMGGDELHAELSSFAIDQAQRMVFVTGGMPPEASEYLEALSNPCLAKPFDPVTLRALIIERVLGERRV